MCYLDGVEEVKGVFVIGTTARPDLIDPAILRSGRIDQHLRCGLPSFEERKKFFEEKLRLLKIDFEEERGHIIEELGKSTDGFSFGNLMGLLRNLQACIFEKLNLKEENEDEKKLSLNLAEIKSELDKIEPLGLGLDYVKFKRIYDGFEKGEGYKPDYERQKQILK